ncbi:hypothetical protein GALL_458230 [mine drainage metagenome]|uniref:Uncharacterized protein n=1 Tax=mine drainage metagenome TaxID=410659 RepID=A0A1J5PM08_9ZZZZ
MVAGHAQAEGAQILAIRSHLEVRAEALLADVPGAEVHLGMGAVGAHLALEAGPHRRGMGIIQAQEHRTIEGHLVGEGHEGILDLLQVAVVIQVLAINVGDHGEGGIQQQEAAIALVRLGHQEGPLAQLGVAADGAELAADDDGGINPALAEHLGDHAGGGGLAVGTGHGDAVLHAHQFRQHLPPGDHGDLRRMGRHHLGVVAPHGAGDDHHLGTFDAGCRMADANRHT